MGTPLKSMNDLMAQELNDLYNTENQLVEIYPEFVNQATSLALRNTFKKQMDESKSLKKRIEELCQELSIPLKNKKSNRFEAILDDSRKKVNHDTPPFIRDARLISNVHRIKHYQIASYGSASVFANLLGQDKARLVLKEALDEEKAADQDLDSLYDRVNIKSNV